MSQYQKLYTSEDSASALDPNYAISNSVSTGFRIVSTSSHVMRKSLRQRHNQCIRMRGTQCEQSAFYT